MEERLIRCPFCSKTSSVVKKIDGSYRCLNCDTVFKLEKLGGLKIGGIKQGYPRIPIPQKLRSYLKLVRPLTLLPPLLVGILCTMLPLLKAGSPILPHSFTLIFVGVTLALLQAAGQISNQIEDVEIDRIAKPYRPLVQGEVTKDEANALLWILAIAGVFRGINLSPLFGSFCLLILLFAIFYNVPPRMKRYAWLGNIWLGVSRGFLPIVACWSVFGSLRNSEPYLLGMMGFVWVTSFNMTKDIPDYEADKKFGVNTIFVKYGLDKGIRIMRLLGGLTIAFIIIGSLLHPIYRFMLPLIPLAIFICKNPKRRASLAENTWSWVGFYAGLGLIYLLAIPYFLI